MWGRRLRNTQEAKRQTDFRGVGAASVWKVTMKRRDGRPCGETAGLMFLVGKIKPAGKIPLEDIWDYIPFHSVLILRYEQEWDEFYKRTLRSLKLEMLKHRTKECLARALLRKPMQLRVVNMAPGNCSLKGLFSFFLHICQGKRQDTQLLERLAQPGRSDQSLKGRSEGVMISSSSNSIKNS